MLFNGAEEIQCIDRVIRLCFNVNAIRVLEFQNTLTNTLTII